MKLFSIPELVNGSNLNTVLGIQYHQCRIRDIQSGNKLLQRNHQNPDQSYENYSFRILPLNTENG